MPVGIRHDHRARLIQLPHLFRREIPPYGSQIIFQLLLIASPDDDGANRGPLQHPVQRHLRYGLTGFCGYGIQRINHSVEVLVVYRGTNVIGLLYIATAFWRWRLASADL